MPANRLYQLAKTRPQANLHRLNSRLLRLTKIPPQVSLHKSINRSLRLLVSPPQANHYSHWIRIFLYDQRTTSTSSKLPRPCWRIRWDLCMTSPSSIPGLLSAQDRDLPALVRRTNDADIGTFRASISAVLGGGANWQCKGTGGTSFQPHIEPETGTSKTDHGQSITFPLSHRKSSFEVSVASQYHTIN